MGIDPAAYRCSHRIPRTLLIKENIDFKAPVRTDGNDAAGVEMQPDATLSVAVFGVDVLPAAEATEREPGAVVDAARAGAGSGLVAAVVVSQG